MKYAVIQLAGKQYKVTEGEKLVVNSLNQNKDAEVNIADVLLVVGDKDVQIGDPLVKGSSVKLKVVENQRSPKLRVATYHAKSRYRRVIGHRQVESVVEVVSIK